MPNLDWGTWITLGATILNAAAGLFVCVGRRSVSARKVMRARVAANDIHNSAGFHMATQHSEPPASHVTDESKPDEATVPRFAQFEVPDHSSTTDHRAETASFRSGVRPPGYDLESTRIPYGRPAQPLNHQHPHQQHRPAGPRQPVVDDAVRSQAARDVFGDRAPAPVDRYDAEPPPPPDPTMHAQDRSMAQRAVSGPRPMPQAHEAVGVAVDEPYGDERADAYYEDTPPEFDRQQRQQYPQPNLYIQPQQPYPHDDSVGYPGQATPPQQPRSPGTVSNSSHFTSVSQRGINPRWAADQRGGMPHSASGGHLDAAAAYEQRQQHSRQRRQQQEQQRQQRAQDALFANPDFNLSTSPASGGVPGAGARRLPKRTQIGPSALGGPSTRGMSHGNDGRAPSAGQDGPYAVAKMT